MLTEVDPLHTVIDIVSPLAIVAAAWIGLSIKSAVLKASLDHQAAAADVKDELIERATKVENAVAVHIADDKGEFRPGQQAAAQHGFNLREALGVDLAWICTHADGIALLPGWRNSKGATAEHAAAVALGLEVIEL